MGSGGAKVRRIELSGIRSEPLEETGTRDLPYPRSEFAEPPITADEARAAEHAVSRYHGDIVGSAPRTNDVEGAVCWCPVGGHSGASPSG